MTKSIYCVYWRWFDKDGKELPRKCVTHSWYKSYRKAKKEFDKQSKMLFANYPGRKTETIPPMLGWSVDDGTYEIQAVKIHAKIGDQEYIRLILAATNII